MYRILVGKGIAGRTSTNPQSSIESLESTLEISAILFEPLNPGKGISALGVDDVARKRKLQPQVKFCSQSFRDRVAQSFVGLDDNYVRWGLLQYLLWGRHRDDRGRLVISAKGVCTVLGYSEKDIEAGNIPSMTVLFDDFSKHVFSLELDEYRFVDGKARVLISDLPEDLMSMFEAERRTRLSPRVVFQTGKVVTKRTIKQHELDYAELAQLEAARIGRTTNTQRLEYMNSRPTNAFTAIVNRNMDAALALATDERDIDILNEIMVQPKPYYAPVAGSARIFPINDSIPRLSRRVREVLTQGWIQADLVGAQLAVVNSIWRPDVQMFGRGVWEYWLSHLKLEYNSRTKTLIKTVLYAYLFGAGVQRVRGMFEERYGVVRGGKLWEKLRSEMAFRELRHARAQIIKKIRNDGQGIDAWGEVLEYQSEIVREQWSGFNVRRDNVRSIMAAIAQSYEQRLLEGVFALARENEDKFTITVDLFDGIYFSVRDIRQTELWCRRLAETLQKSADELGVDTTFAFEKDGALLEYGWQDGLGGLSSTGQ